MLSSSSTVFYTVSVVRTFKYLMLECRYLYTAVRYDTRCYFNVRSKADMSRLNLPQSKNCKTEKTLFLQFLVVVSGNPVSSEIAPRP